MNRILTSFLAAGAALLLADSALALQAGWRPLEVAGNGAAEPPIKGALYYPTQAPARAVPMGPFTANVAIAAVPAPSVKALIVLSHGTGGSEMGHGSLAEALAGAGYLVASLRHPGDNWQDRSLLQQRPQAFFGERPRQASRVIDALLHDPQWKDRIASDARGPMVGALGHSAGGYTVLALAGGQPDLQRLATHCTVTPADDPIFCRTGRSERSGASMGPAAASPAAPPAMAPLRDPRVRAVAALAPVGAVFSSASLAAIDVPVLVYGAEADRWLVPRFHAEWIARNLAQGELRRVPSAGHFAFMDRPAVPIDSEDGDVGADPAGFDRPAFLQRLASELVIFFDRTLR